jgi:hypothetical protein
LRGQWLQGFSKIIKGEYIFNSYRLNNSTVLNVERIRGDFFPVVLSFPHENLADVDAPAVYTSKIFFAMRY